MFNNSLSSIIRINAISMCLVLLAVCNAYGSERNPGELTRENALAILQQNPDSFRASLSKVIWPYQVNMEQQGQHKGHLRLRIRGENRGLSEKMAHSNNQKRLEQLRVFESHGLLRSCGHEQEQRKAFSPISGNYFFVTDDLYCFQLIENENLLEDGYLFHVVELSRVTGIVQEGIHAEVEVAAMDMATGVRDQLLAALREIDPKTVIPMKGYTLKYSFVRYDDGWRVQSGSVSETITF
ncbi:MAG: hypothetical protein WD898_01785 [Candidatus Paceibacterota bacterium]